MSHGPSLPGLVLVGVILAVACALGTFMLLWGEGRPLPLPLLRGGRAAALVEGERDMAARLGWPPRRWFALRLLCTVLGLSVGILSHVALLMVSGAFAGFLGFRFAMSGRAMGRQLHMERAFLAQLRNLRDRMAVSHQSLDTALQEIGRNPGSPELAHVLAPLSRGGSVVDNLVESGVRSRSPLIENAFGVLIWARSRSLDAIIQAIDEVLTPVGEAQLAVREEAMVTLTQQRAVTCAMALLMLVMFGAVMRVEVFRSYYETVTGNLVLGLVLGLFTLLVLLLGMIVRIDSWSRWDLRRLAGEQGRLGG
ncbi:MAG: hypothetical protein ABR564_00155 [Candidatus Dormibacteria bacterium]